MAKSHKPSRDITAEKKAGTLKSGVAVDKKKNKVKRKESFSLYIHKVFFFFFFFLKFSLKAQIIE